MFDPRRNLPGYKQLPQLNVHFTKRRHPTGVIKTATRIHHLHPYIQSAMDDRAHIGWICQALHGFLSIHWRPLAENDAIIPDKAHGDIGETQVLTYRKAIQRYIKDM